MRVTYTRRLGQNEAGSTHEVTDIEGTWLVNNRYATLSTEYSTPTSGDHDKGTHDHDKTSTDDHEKGNDDHSVGARTSTPRRKR